MCKGNCEKRNKEFLERLEEYFQMKITIPRIRIRKKQELETQISEEALLFARFIRCEKGSWIPRVIRLD
jgi:hypothetical protein